jgi:predicted glycosyltransferase
MLSQRGYEIILTARDCFQVRELAALYGTRCKLLGSHYGRNKLLKVVGLLIRALQLLPAARRQKPALALSHGSRAQVLAAGLLRIPSAVILDYEHVARLPFIRPDWVLAPEHISNYLLMKYAHRVIKYPGIKEEVYASDFEPEDRILSKLGIDQGDLVVTVRPPATEAHYHHAQSATLFAASMDFISRRPDTRIILLPRNEKQRDWVKKKWPKEFKHGKIIMPEFVPNGSNLIWHSDLVISGGGTMSREAAVLGIPAYSVFCGVLGGVDQYLMQSGRLVMLQSVAEIRAKLVLARRLRHPHPEPARADGLKCIVNTIAALAQGPMQEPEGLV